MTKFIPSLMSDSCKVVINVGEETIVFDLRRTGRKEVNKENEAKKT